MLTFLPPAKEVWSKVIFLHLSFCSQGEGLPHCMLGKHPPGTTHPPEQTPPGTRHPPFAQCMLGDTVKQAGGMHPTGMQSCCTTSNENKLEVFANEINFNADLHLS